MGRGRDDVTVGVDIGPGRATIAAIQNDGVVIWDDWRAPVDNDEVVDALLEWLDGLENGRHVPVVITHPVGRSRRELRRLRHRLEHEGLKRVGAMPTGEAAARDHARHRIVPDPEAPFSVAVLDLGERSGELTLLQRGPDEWEIIGAVHQLVDLSAAALRADVRAAIEQHVDGIEITPVDLDRAVEGAVTTLVGSTATSVDVTVGQRRMILRRRTLLAPFFDRISALGHELPDLVAEVGLDTGALEALVLCGGLADMPEAVAKLDELVDCPVHSHGTPRQAAARGAAWAASGLAGGAPRWLKTVAAGALVALTVGGMVGLSQVGETISSDEAQAAGEFVPELETEPEVLGESVSRSTAALALPTIALASSSTTAVPSPTAPDPTAPAPGPKVPAPARQVARPPLAPTVPTTAPPPATAPPLPPTVPPTTAAAGSGVSAPTSSVTVAAPILISTTTSSTTTTAPPPPPPTTLPPIIITTTTTTAPPPTSTTQPPLITTTTRLTTTTTAAPTTTTTAAPTTTTAAPTTTTAAPTTTTAAPTTTTAAPTTTTAAPATTTTTAAPTTTTTAGAPPPLI